MMNPGTSAVLKPHRGRLPRVDRQSGGMRRALIRSGFGVLTETSYLATGIEAVIRNIDVPKGSFYHCFKNKEAFSLAVLNAYSGFFAHKLDKFPLDGAIPPLERMAALMRHTSQGVEKYQFRRGCLVGDLLQEAPLLPDAFLGRLKAVLTAWKPRVARCLHKAQAAGVIARDVSPDTLAQILWIGWKGTVMRTRLYQSAAPLDQYREFFTHSMTTKTPAQDGISAGDPLPTRSILS